MRTLPLFPLRDLLVLRRLFVCQGCYMRIERTLFELVIFHELCFHPLVDAGRSSLCAAGAIAILARRGPEEASRCEAGRGPSRRCDDPLLSRAARRRRSLATEQLADFDPSRD